MKNPCWHRTGQGCGGAAASGGAPLGSVAQFLSALDRSDIPEAVTLSGEVNLDESGGVVVARNIIIDSEALVTAPSFNTIRFIGTRSIVHREGALVSKAGVDAVGAAPGYALGSGYFSDAGAGGLVALPTNPQDNGTNFFGAVNAPGSGKYGGRGGASAASVPGGFGHIASADPVAIGMADWRATNAFGGAAPTYELAGGGGAGAAGAGGDTGGSGGACGGAVDYLSPYVEILGEVDVRGGRGGDAADDGNGGGGGGGGGGVGGLLSVDSDTFRIHGDAFERIYTDGGAGGTGHGGGSDGEAGEGGHINVKGRRSGASSGGGW